MPRIIDIVRAIEEAAPRSAQEQWDNSGLLVVAGPERECSGVMLCLDVTPRVMTQAIERGCNLVISHHPLVFKGVKTISDETVQGEALIMAVKNDISVYCAHTSLDNAGADWNVSAEMARMMDMRILRSMTDTGTGVFAETAGPALRSDEFARRCREIFSASGVRMSIRVTEVRTAVFGSGSCGFLIPDAIASGADAIVTSDVRYHDFLDYGNSIFIVDLTHFDTEKCTKTIFKRIISQKFPNFALVFCASETNPIAYL